MRITKHLLLALITVLLNITVTAAQDVSSACPQTQFRGFGQVGVVTPGDANNLRDEPSTSGKLIGKVQPDEPFNVIANAVACADGYLWREIETVTLRGWTVERTIDGGDPWIVPYEQPEPREVGTLQGDGTILVEEAGISFTVPAAFGAASVTVQPEVGLFGDGMSAQPSSIVFTLLNEDEEALGEIEIFPHAIDKAVYDFYWKGNVLETIVGERPSLTEFAAERTMPYFPYGGAVALFDGVPMYVESDGAVGVRYVTMFAQDDVIFTADSPFFVYEYRGLSAESSFFIASSISVRVPAAAIPAPVTRASDAYRQYIQRFETNLAAQPTSAFTPDLALLDTIFASLTITNHKALLELIP
jgi:hypothetical protein